MSNVTSNMLADLSRTPSMFPTGRSRNWFEAFAASWGSALDNQAAKIEAQSNVISGEDGTDTPSEITKLTAESMRMSFMAQSSHTSLDSVSKALETMARKN